MKHPAYHLCYHPGSWVSYHPARNITQDVRYRNHSNWGLNTEWAIEYPSPSSFLPISTNDRLSRHFDYPSPTTKLNWRCEAIFICLMNFLWRSQSDHPNTQRDFYSFNLEWGESSTCGFQLSCRRSVIAHRFSYRLLTQYSDTRTILSNSSSCLGSPVKSFRLSRVLSKPPTCNFSPAIISTRKVDKIRDKDLYMATFTSQLEKLLAYPPSKLAVNPQEGDIYIHEFSASAKRQIWVHIEKQWKMAEVEHWHPKVETHCLYMQHGCPWWLHWKSIVMYQAH